MTKAKQQAKVSEVAEVAVEETAPQVAAETKAEVVKEAVSPVKGVTKFGKMIIQDF